VVTYTEPPPILAVCQVFDNRISPSRTYLSRVFPLSFGLAPPPRLSPNAMSAPEMKRFADSLVALSTSAVELMKTMDQRAANSKRVIEELNTVIVQTSQVANRQRQIITALGQKYTEVEAQLKMAKEELRRYRESPTSATGIENTEPNFTNPEPFNPTTGETGENAEGSAGPKDRKFSLPSMKDLLHELDTHYEGAFGVPRRESVSIFTPNERASQLISPTAFSSKPAILWNSWSTTLSI
jgi:uncharacterized coiled-coil protein SlyX